MTKEEYKEQFTDDDAVGWLFIDNELERLYPDQEPKHYGTVINYRLGGEDPLDGLSIYVSENQTGHFHIVSYGFTNLYYFGLTTKEYAELKQKSDEGRGIRLIEKIRLENPLFITDLDRC